MLMLGTFPKAFLKGYFPKWKLPNCAISQATTSQVCLSRSTRPQAYPSLCARPPKCSLRRLERPNLTFGKLPLGKLNNWGVVTWEVAIVKMPL